MLLNFDYDGVIVDSLDQLLAACVQAQRQLGVGRALTVADFATIENLTFEELGRRAGLPLNQIPAFCRAVYELQEREWTVQPFAGIVPTFEALAQQHHLVVITASQTEAVRQSLDSFGLDGVVSQVLGGELGLTKAERIRQACEAFQVAPADAFMIGDAVSDIRQGKQAGVRTAAVTWGFQNRDLLEREGPDVILDQPADLLTLEAT